MGPKDSFPYLARWDSVGLDCSYCKHFQGPDEWPDKQKESRCIYHDISLSIELARNGFKEGEWFCTHFENNGKANERAVAHFKDIKTKLSEAILYQLHQRDGYLKEHPIKTLKAQSNKSL